MNMYKKMTLALICAATAAGCFAAGVPCGNVALREVVRGPDALAVSITTNAAGHAVLDFGKHQFGWLEVDVKKPGPYKIVWGELLDEKGAVQTGRRYTRSEGRIRCATTEGVFDGVGTQRIPYTTGNGNAYFMGNRQVKRELPKFGMVMPFRWAEIVALPFPVASDTVRQVPIYYPYDMAESRFDSDNDALNRVYGFCKHSIRATTFTGLFIDGDRERWPYEADSYITQLSTYAMTSDYSLARKMVDHLRDNSTWPTEWKQFFIRMCHADWMYTGRPDRIAAHYEAMKTQKLWLNFAREDGLLVTGTKEAEAKGAKDIVDWARCYRDGFEFRPVNAVVNALHYRNLMEMSEMAAAIGKQDDARAFAERARKVRASFIKAFVDPASGLVRDGEGSKHLTVHANAMAVACGVLSGREASAPADFIVKKGMRCSTYMSQFVLEALFMAGRSDEAFKLMTTDGPRGWMQMMKLGATVSMEFWDLTLKEPGRVPDMNHAWSTAPLNVTVRHLLGVMPLKPGFEEIRFAPQFGPLTRLSAAVPTARGVFTVDARREGGRWTVDLVTPAPVKVVTGEGERSLPAGSHRVYFAATAQGLQRNDCGNLSR